MLPSPPPEPAAFFLLSNRGLRHRLHSCPGAAAAEAGAEGTPGYVVLCAPGAAERPPRSRSAPVLPFGGTNTFVPIRCFWGRESSHLA